MNCFDIEPIIACIKRADGTSESVLVHYSYGKNAAGTEIIKSVRYTDILGTIVTLAAGDTIALGDCSCQLAEHYLCLAGVLTPVWVSLDCKTHQILKVTNTLDLTDVAAADYLSGFKSPCSDCGIRACILLDAFDTMSENALSPGEFMEMQLILDGVVISTTVHDYLTTSDTVNKSTWYGPWISAINALPNWSISLDTDTASTGSGKVTWLVEYNGPGNETLRIYKGSVGGAPTFSDYMQITVDGAGVVTTETGTGNLAGPWSSYPFTVTTCP